MVFKVDFINGDVVKWHSDSDNWSREVDQQYTPSFYIASSSKSKLEEIEDVLRRHPDVDSIDYAEQRTRWRNAAEVVLKVDAVGITELRDAAHEVRSWGDPGEYKLFNVDFSREFRYCIETGTEPVPNAPLSVAELEIPPKQVSDSEIAPLEFEGETFEGSPQQVLRDLNAAIDTADPDVLVINSSDIIPLLYSKATEISVDEFQLGRMGGWQQLAEESTFTSYGRVGHSPARYNIPGRSIIDKSNTFFWDQTNLDGMLDLVGRSWQPLQEISWASIGRVLTGIQIREARNQGVLVPWKSWRHEKFKTMRTLHASDRGGYIFSPEVGFHENVHELDFASLYPNIIVTRNVSPDKIRCECCDTEDVPELGYSICDEEGYLPDVLEPIISDREEYKNEIAAIDDPEREEKLRGRSEALKWILVSCFGYQGFSNAKFGRIECHEAINAFARQILIDTKEIFERNGWEVVHGIVDSIWVVPQTGKDRTPIQKVAEEVTEEIGISLDYEGEYEWIAFLPRKDAPGGALNKYYGKFKNDDEFKKRGIELRQRSTPEYIKECQTTHLEIIDAHRDPEAVCEKLQDQIDELRNGDVDPEQLLIKRRVSKAAEDYTHRTRNVSALKRAQRHDFEIMPGENVRYVVADDSKRSEERVRLEYETLDRYDAEFYSDLLIRSVETLISPFGWGESDIREYLSGTRDGKIISYAH